MATNQFDDATGELLTSILETKISPELIPETGEGEIQSTENIIGPYTLHDFFLYHVLKYGMAPSKIAYLAWNAWADPRRGDWPPGYPGG